ncbi:MAG: phosphoglycerate kinase [Solirubrobacterales bacterium]
MSTLRDIDISNKRVLVRADLNVPTDSRGEILDDTRIRESLPTLEYLIEKGAKVIVMSHLGRPKGERSERYSMNQVVIRLRAALERDVKKLNDCVGPEVQQAINDLKPGEVMLLENLRFHPGEEKNDPEFCRELAQLGDLYVNDAFGAAHRAHASISGITDYIPSVCGFLMEKEVTMLRKVMNTGESPRIAIVGGAKVSDKLKLLENLLERMDVVIIGGGMANTFLKAQGIPVGSSLCEDSLLDSARDLMRQADEKGISILLPTDVAIAPRFHHDAERRVVPVHEVPDGWMILDIGPETAACYKEAIGKARTILWNGPMGVYEFESFSTGTDEVARAVADAQGVSVVGGGDSLAAVYKLNLQDQITHVSTGGGATLEFLEGKRLPGLVYSKSMQQLVG